MMTSSNGNIFRVTGHLCGEFTGPRWIPRTKASDAKLLCFLWSAPWIKGWVNNCEAGDLRRHRAHYDVIIMSECMYCFTWAIMQFVYSLHSCNVNDCGQNWVSQQRLIDRKASTAMHCSLVTPNGNTNPVRLWLVTWIRHPVITWTNVDVTRWSLVVFTQGKLTGNAKKNLASQITGVSIVCSAVYSGADERKHKSSASLPHKGQ